MIRFDCPKCGKSIKAPDNAAGARGRCPGCGEVFHIPKLPPPVPTPAGAEALQARTPAQAPGPSSMPSSPPPTQGSPRAVAAPGPTPSAAPLQQAAGTEAAPAGNSKLRILGIAAACAVVAAVLVAGWMLGWFGGAPSVPSEVSNPKPQAPSADAAKLLAQLDRIAKASDGSVGIRAQIKKITWKVHAAFGDTANALLARGADSTRNKFEVLGYILESALRRGDRDGVKRAADSIYALALADQEKPQSEVSAQDKAGYIRSAARAYALVNESGRFREILGKIQSTGNGEQGREELLGTTCRISLEHGNPSGALLAVEETAPSSRASWLAVYMAPAYAAKSDKASELKCYRDGLKAMAAGKGITSRGETLRYCLLGLCEHKLFDEAAKAVISVAVAEEGRNPLLNAVVLCQAAAGDAAGAIRNARAGGDLMQAAELAADTPDKKQAIADALHVYAVLPNLPETPAWEPMSRMQPEDPAATARVRMLRRIAKVLFRVGADDEGRIVLDQGRAIVAERRPPAYDTLMGELAAGDLEGIRARLTAGDTAAAQKAVALLAVKPGSAACVSRAWAEIGAAMWKAGNKNEAAAAFSKAVAVAQGIPRPRGFTYNRISGIAAVQAVAGDVEGAVRTLAIPEGGEIDDEHIGDVAVARFRAGDLNGALETAGILRSLEHRYTQILGRVLAEMADRGDLEGALQTYVANARGDGSAPSDPVELLGRAIEAGKDDLVLKYCGPNHASSVAEYVAKAVKAGKKQLAQAILDKCLEHQLAAPESSRPFLDCMQTVRLMADCADKSKALEALHVVVERAESAHRSYEVLTDTAVEIMVRAGSLDDVLAMAAKMPNQLEREQFLRFALEAVTGPVLRDRTPRQMSRPSSGKPTQAQKIFSEQVNHLRQPGEEITPPPYIAPGSKPPSVELVAPKAPEAAWPAQTILASARTARGVGPTCCAVFVREGSPVFFFLDVPAPPRGWSVMRVHKTPSGWEKEEFAKPPAGASYDHVDAATIGGVPYVALSSAQTSSEQLGSLEVRALRDAKWTTVFENRDVAAQYGQQVALGSVGGRPVAAYTDKYPPPGDSSRNAKFLEQGADGKWTEDRLPVPYVAGIVHLSVGEVGGDAAVLVSTGGGSGKHFGRRTGGKWSFERVGDLREGSGQLFDLGGNPAWVLIGTGREARDSTIAFGRGGQGSNARLVLPETADPWPMDVAAVGGRPAAAYYDRQSRKMFYCDLGPDGSWKQSEISIGHPLRPVGQLRLFEIDGKPAVVFFETAEGGEALQFAQPR